MTCAIAHVAFIVIIIGGFLIFTGYASAEEGDL